MPCKLVNHNLQRHLALTGPLVFCLSFVCLFVCCLFIYVSLWHVGFAQKQLTTTVFIVFFAKKIFAVQSVSVNFFEMAYE